jgi:elongation factor P
MSSYDTSEFRSGLKILLDKDPFTIVENEFVKPGKGQAFNRVRIKNLRTGRVIERTFKSGESVEAADVVDTDMQFLYADGQFWHFMNPESYEQLAAGETAVGDAAQWLKDGTVCIVTLWNGQPLTVTPPAHVELKIIETDPGMRGDTVTGGTKPAKLETGAVVKVPLFLNEGEVIRVDTRSASRQSHAATTFSTSDSRSRASAAVKRSKRGLSRSSTPMRRPPSTSGTTTSEFDAASQAMWPGKRCTSGTISVARRSAAVPQTPWPSGMRTQATRPWNGPTTSPPPRRK